MSPTGPIGPGFSSAARKLLAEILFEAFDKVEASFAEELGLTLRREDLILGCFYAIEDKFPRGPRAVRVQRNPPPVGEKEKH